MLASERTLAKKEAFACGDNRQVNSSVLERKRRRSLPPASSIPFGWRCPQFIDRVVIDV